MGRSMVLIMALRVVTACAVAITVTGCGAEAGGNGAAVWSSPSATSEATPKAPQASATSAPDRVKEITAACKLLPADVVVDVLGGSASAKLTAKEDPVERLAEGLVRHGCTYGQGGKEPFSLLVSVRPNRAADAAAAIEAIGQASGTKTTAIKGVGAGGVGYITGAHRVVAIAVPYEDQLRLVIFTGPKVVPHAKLVEVAKRVVVQV